MLNMVLWGTLDKSVHQMCVNSSVYMMYASPCKEHVVLLCATTDTVWSESTISCKTPVWILDSILLIDDNNGDNLIWGVESCSKGSITPINCVSAGWTLFAKWPCCYLLWSSRGSGDTNEWGKMNIMERHRALKDRTKHDNGINRCTWAVEMTRQKKKRKKIERRCHSQFNLSTFLGCNAFYHVN